MSLTTLRRDPVVVVTAGLLFALSAPLVLPLLSADNRIVYSETSTTLPFLMMAIVAFRWRLGELVAREQRFWNLMSFAISCWIAQQLVVIGTKLGIGILETRILDDVLYVALYLFLVLAVDQRPHRSQGGGGRNILNVLRRIGTVVFLFGLLVYLVIVPAEADPQSYGAMLPSFTLYGLLDAYLVIRVLGLLRSTADPRWRRVYRWLLVTFALWFCLDAAEAMLWAEILPWVNPGTVWDLPWMLGSCVLVLVGRSREREPGDDLAQIDDRASAEDHESFLGGPLILTAMLVPMLHFSVYGLRLFSELTRRSHEMVAFSVMLVLGGLLLVYQRILEERNRRLDSQRRQALEVVEHQAFHDSLTDLPNRRLLWDRLGQSIAQAERRKELLAVLFFDLDGFKAVNDTRGHAVGDELLAKVGLRLAASVRASDTVARFGGDEFVVLAPVIDGRESAAALGQKVLDSLREPFECAGEEVSISASVGLSIYPDDAGDREALLSHADAAMYEAKKGARGLD